MNARAKRAGLNTFMPVPPNTSLPMITAKAVDTATIHNGASTGIIIGMSMPDTRKPSLTSVAAYLREGELYAEAYHVRYYYKGNTFQKPKPKHP